MLINELSVNRLTLLWQRYLHHTLKIVIFVQMKKLRNLFKNWRRPIKLSISNPANFDEIWSVSTSKVQLVSLFLLIFVLISVGVGFFILKSPFGDYLQSDKEALKRNQLVEQKLSIDRLTKKLDAQEKYIDNIKMIILGEKPKDSISTMKNEVRVDPNKIDGTVSPEERVIADKVKDDLRTTVKKKSVMNVHFIAPVKGKISQVFDAKNHQGTDVVTPENKSVLACLSGTVIYSGFSQKDGHILIVEHANDFISVYKHNQARLKKTGDRVRTGDPIAIVGNSGENSNGPHLHFELWLNQKPVNPEDYIQLEMKQ